MRSIVAPALFLTLANCAFAGFVGTAFNAPGTAWSSADAVIGVAGYTIVDFESVVIPTSLRVTFVNGFDGVTGNWDTALNGGQLPFVVSPADDTTGLDAFGPTYGDGAWDGSKYLVNVPGIPITSYLPSTGWGTITLYFLNGATSVGFSLQQQESLTGILINGSFSTSTTGLGLAQGGTQNGYLRIDATGGSTINSIQLSPGCCTDGWALDHVAYLESVPEPGTFGVALIASAALLMRMRRRFNSSASSTGARE